ncbi:MAG: ComEA family DNA-binding protein [Planctomycetota bacterium]
MALLVRAFADGMLAHGGALGPVAVPVTIDLNRASMAALQALPGIGPERAQAIVLHRVRHGPFAAVDELVAVDGIGPETVDGLRQHAVAVAPAGERR